VSAFLHNLVVFGRLLRGAGLDVHTGRLIDVANALTYVDLGHRAEVYHVCRALLTHRREDLATFDRIFDQFWRVRGLDVRALTTPPNQARAPRAPQAEAMLEMALGAGEDEPESPDENEQEGDQQTWSDAAILAHKDFAEFTAGELAVARAAIDRLTWTPGLRRTRRWEAGRGSRLDVRRAIARSLRTGGDIVRLPRERRRLQPRPLVLLCDISGSMEQYSRVLVHFAHALARRQSRLEVFLFSTTLTRVTTDMRRRGLDEALRRVTGAVRDWSGGTRIGDALRQLNQRWSRRVLVRGPVVLLISDGWDRGEPGVIRSEIARLQRTCHRLIWLNPLIGTTDYAPLTRGLQAALPFVDDFMPVRTLSNLADLAVHLNALDR
jgi:uncharacterized protein